MKTETITATEFANLYGCSTQFVTRKLRLNTGLVPMIDFKKSGGTWLVHVPSDWIKNKSVPK